jgi:hypothetical protein
MIFSTDIIRAMDIHHQLDKLRVLKNLSHDDSALIYLALTSAFKSYDQLNLVCPYHLNNKAPFRVTGVTRWAYTPCDRIIPSVRKSPVFSRRSTGTD